MFGPTAVALLIPLCAAQWWDVDIQPAGVKTVDVTRENAGVSIQCTATNMSSGILNWYDTAGRKINDSSSGAGDQGPLVISKQTSLELKIPRPRINVDSGNYTCRGTGNDGVTKEKSVQLIVYEGIQLTSPFQQFSLYGQDGLINCSSSASLPRSTQFFFSNWTALAGDRYRVNDDYVIITNFTQADEGEYRCSIHLEDQTGDARDYGIRLASVVLPEFTGPVTIEPREPKEGQEILVRCNASAKPQPTYQFFKVEGNETRRFAVRDEGNGSIRFQNVTQADDGNYTCVASHGWGSVSQTFSVDVYSPLVITDTKSVPEETTGTTQSEGQLVCAATGDPEPVLSWKREDYYFRNTTESEINGRIYTKTESPESKPEGLKRIVHTLVFRSLEPSDVGPYTCEASNKYAVVNSSLVFIFPFKPDLTRQTATRVFVWINASAMLTCTATGHPEPLLSWLHNGTKIDSNGDGDYKLLPLKTEGTAPVQVTSTLKITMTDGNKNKIIGNYTCRGENKHGLSEKQLELAEAYLPAAPEVNVMDVKPTSLELGVAPPQDNGGQPILEYHVEYASVDSLDQRMTVSINLSEPAPTHVRLQRLQVNTTYAVKVSAITNVGRGSASNVTVATLHASPPDVVVVTSDNITSEVHQYLLSWRPPYSGGCNITGYDIEYATVSVDSNGSWTVSPSPEHYTKVHVPFPQSSHLFENLEENTYYYVRISASNILGQSKATDFFFKTDMEDELTASPPVSYSEIRSDVKPMLIITIAVPVVVLVLTVSLVVGVILSRKARNKRHLIEMEVLKDCDIFQEPASRKVSLREISDSNAKAEDQPLPKPLIKVFEDLSTTENKMSSEEEHRKEHHVNQESLSDGKPEPVETAEADKGREVPRCLIQM